jgi:RimJ/RimL family protein N-acetyltransferase
MEDYTIDMGGYVLFNQYCKKGYAKRSIEAMIRIRFDDLGYHRLEKHINLDNDISEKVENHSGI